MGKSKNCLICYDSFKLYYRLSCGSICCFQCLIQWVKTQSQIYQSNPVYLPCIAYNCKLSINFLEIYPTLPEYCKKQLDDIRVKIIERLRDFEKSCTCKRKGNRNGICNRCGQKQKSEETKYSRFKIMNRFYLMINLYKKRKCEFLTEKWKQFYTRPCPNCEVNIEKNGGCDHMTCFCCQYQYCWTCESKYPTHDFSRHRIDQKRKYTFKLVKSVLILIAMLLIYQIPFVKVITKEVLLFSWKMSPCIAEGIVWIYYKAWRFFLSFVFIRNCPSVISSKVLNKDKTGSIFCIILCLIITHFWGGYETMLKISLGEILIGYLIDFALYIRRIYKQRRIIKTFKSIFKPVASYKAVLMLFGLAVIGVQIAEITLVHNKRPDLKLSL